MTPNRCSDLSPHQAQFVLVLVAIIALIGAVCSWGRGNLPTRVAVRETQAVGVHLETNPTEVNIAPDLQLYRDVVAQVRRGENYYAAAKPELLKHFFPVRSTFNWRLPTYAWLFSLLPGPWAVQGLLVILAVIVDQFARKRQL